MLKANQLRDRITITKFVSTGNDSWGIPEGATENVATVWADVKELSQSEAEGTDAVRNQKTFTITIRHNETITPKMAIVWHGRTLNISSVVHDVVVRSTTITATEVT